MRARRGSWVAAVVAIVLVAAAAGAVALIRGQRRSADQRAAVGLVRQFLTDWSQRRYAALAALTDGRTAHLGARYASLDRTLAIADVVPKRVSATGDDPVRVRFTAAVTLAGLGRWSDAGELAVDRHGGRWRIRWTPQAVSAALGAGDHLRETRTLPPRAPVLSADGVALSGDAELNNAVAGEVTRATAKQAAADPLTLRTGDPIGVANLERLDNAQLAGRASGALQVLDRRGHVVRTLARFSGSPPRPVRTTLSMRLQRLAESVIAGTGRPTALVALDAATGSLLATASSSATYPVGLLGRFPPGSTFKMVTLTAALEHGWTLDRTVDCTPTLDVDGRLFHNATGEPSGVITLERAFAVSCNTAFMRVAETLPPGALLAAAKAYGCDTGHAPLIIVSYGCSVPTAASGTAYAAEAIGQGTVLTSTLSIAAIAAGIDAGTWHQPTVLPGESRTSHPLPPTVVAALHTAMRAVVTSGTGVPANLPGTPVYGKTGTAEYGTGNPPPTDAWFAAFRGPLAVAVVVQGAGFGEASAAPLVARFLAVAGG